MPWDAEDNADAFCQTPHSSSLLTCIEREENAWPELMTPLNSQAQPAAADKLDQGPYSQLHAATMLPQSLPYSDVLLLQPRQAEYHAFPPERVAALEGLTLRLQEYTELHSFLTKDSQVVQPASAKEKALYKLADLRQVYAA